MRLSITIDTGGFSMSVSADSSIDAKKQTTYTNSNLNASNIKIKVKEDTTIRGATLNATDTLALSTKNLSVESVQDKQSKKSFSMGVSAGVGGGGLNSLGANASKSNANSKQTVLTSLTGAKVIIDVEEHTNIKGATIASIDADGNDNNNLTLNTNTISVLSLINRDDSKSIGGGVSASGTLGSDGEPNGNGKHDSALSTVSLDFQSDSTHTKTKTLATLGLGNINIGNKEDSNTKTLKC